MKTKKPATRIEFINALHTPGWRERLSGILSCLGGAHKIGMQIEVHEERVFDLFEQEINRAKIEALKNLKRDMINDPFCRVSDFRVINESIVKLENENQ